MNTIDRHVTQHEAKAAKTKARREAVRRGGHVWGVGVDRDKTDGYYIVVFVNNEVIPEQLIHGFFVGEVPVVTVNRGAPVAVGNTN